MTAVRLHRLTELRNYKLYSTDGDVGLLEDVYFDDSTWTTRYLVVNAGGWPTEKRVLVSTVAVGDIDGEKGEIAIELSRRQIKDSPPLDREKPVSRQYEADYFRFYGWPPYWETATISPALSAFEDDTPPANEERRRLEDSHLRCSREVAGYCIMVEDGEVGHVADFVIDGKNSKICYLEIDARNWWSGKHILLNPAWIAAIDWHARNVAVDLRGEDIRAAPAYDPKAVISRDYEVKLFEHYARRKYWE